MTTITIDKKKCTNCRMCMSICPSSCYGIENGEVLAKQPEKCIFCRACELQCPHQAIDVQE